MPCHSRSWKARWYSVLLTLPWRAQKSAIFSGGLPGRIKLIESKHGHFQKNTAKLSRSGRLFLKV